MYHSLIGKRYRQRLDAANNHQQGHVQENNGGESVYHLYCACKYVTKHNFIKLQ